jgi:hypothetical protein
MISWRETERLQVTTVAAVPDGAGFSFEKLIDAQLVELFFAFMEHRCWQ